MMTLKEEYRKFVKSSSLPPQNFHHRAEVKFHPPASLLSPTLLLLGDSVLLCFLNLRVQHKD